VLRIQRVRDDGRLNYRMTMMMMMMMLGESMQVIIEKREEKDSIYMREQEGECCCKVERIPCDLVDMCMLCVGLPAPCFNM
jgi:hypothetical protein